jgi:hypothetical protein
MRSDPIEDSAENSPPGNAALEHQRALGRARAARLRARRKASAAHVQNERAPAPAPAEHGNGKGNGHSNGVTELPGARRLANVCQRVAQGVPITRALREQGYSPASRGATDAVRVTLAASLQDAAVTVTEICAGVKDAMGAKTPMLMGEGCIDRPDWTARQGGRRDAIALLDRAGLLPAATPQAVGTQITVNVLRYDDHRSTIRDNDRVDAPAIEAECNDNG